MIPSRVISGLTVSDMPRRSSTITADNNTLAGLGGSLQLVLLGWK